ncbi:hypothetical protein D910_11569 [Dendroctonus ponderosae]|uniref:Peptidase S8 pro-domain domain-containing protein n=1 Tax=Dendroctonus ponderosae TaxID=77166 RepID=U4UP60_DENPD|nr:hypothetical protein D910_11569 [Dendroctonus ponderosae]
MKFYLNLVCVIIVVTSCILSSHAHYTQQWAVHIPGGSQVAEEVAADHGFVNHGLAGDVSDIFDKTTLKGFSCPIDNRIYRNLQTSYVVQVI